MNITSNGVSSQFDRLLTYIAKRLYFINTSFVLMMNISLYFLISNLINTLIIMEVLRAEYADKSRGGPQTHFADWFLFFIYRIFAACKTHSLNCTLLRLHFPSHLPIPRQIPNANFTPTTIISVLIATRLSL